MKSTRSCWTSSRWVCLIQASVISAMDVFSTHRLACTPHRTSNPRKPTLTATSKRRLWTFPRRRSTSASCRRCWLPSSLGTCTAARFTVDWLVWSARFLRMSWWVVLGMEHAMVVQDKLIFVTVVDKPTARQTHRPLLLRLRPRLHHVLLHRHPTHHPPRHASQPPRPSRHTQRDPRRRVRRDHETPRGDAPVEELHAAIGPVEDVSGDVLFGECGRKV